MITAIEALARLQHKLAEGYHGQRITTAAQELPPFALVPFAERQRHYEYILELIEETRREATSKAT